MVFRFRAFLTLQWCCCEVEFAFVRYRCCEMPVNTILHRIVADPGFGIRCLFDPGIRDGKKLQYRIRIRDEQPGSYFSYSLETVFWIKILKLCCGSGIEDPGCGIE
jgi:hypothetical protein